MKSIVIISPAAIIQSANAFCADLGWGSDTITVPIRRAGADTVTHFGARGTISDQDKATFDVALALSGLDKLLSVDIRDDSKRAGHFEEVTIKLGLEMETYPD